MGMLVHHSYGQCVLNSTEHSVIFVNENKNENGKKRENNEFVNEN